MKIRITDIIIIIISTLDVKQNANPNLFNLFYFIGFY